MAVFAPTDPGPATRRVPAEGRGVTERITTPPWAMPVRATCPDHAAFTDGCSKCDTAITLRTEIRARQQRNHIAGMARQNRWGR